MMNSARMQFVILGLAITLGILVLIQSTNYVTAQGGNGNVTGQNSCLFKMHSLAQYLK